MPVYEAIKQDIVSGVYKSGDILPSSKELMKKYSTYSNIIQAARKRLADEGLIKSVWDGSRTVVTYAN